MVAGREFHSFGAQFENVLSPYVAVLLLGINNDNSLQCRHDVCGHALAIALYRSGMI